jgi:hypothetical protein
LRAFPKRENASLTLIQGKNVCIEAKTEKCWFSCLKIIFLGVISRRKIDCAIPEA